MTDDSHIGRDQYARDSWRRSSQDSDLRRQLELWNLPQFRCGPLTIEPGRRIVVEGRPDHEILMGTSPRDAILVRLALSPGRAVFYDELKDAAWGTDRVLHRTAVQNQISLLRGWISEVGLGEVIAVVFLGKRFCAYRLDILTTAMSTQ